MYREIPLPASIAFEPINLCNAKCYCCPYTTLSEDKTYHGKLMTKEQLGMLLHDYGSLIKKYKVADYTCAVSPWRYSDPLVQPNLEYIMELCDHYKIKVGICTNGVSFTRKQCEILNKYIHLIGNVHMSVIGHTAEELWEFMKIKKDKTLKSLRFVKEEYPELSKRLAIGVKHKNQSAAASASTIAEYQNVTLGRVKSKRNWVENRMGDGDGDWTKPYNAVIDEKSFDKIASFIEYTKTKDDAKIICGGKYDKSVGYFVEPTVVLTTNPHFRTMCEEIFGPFMTIYVYDADGYEEALQLMQKNFPEAKVTETTAGHFLQEEVSFEIANALKRIIDKVI